MTRMLNDDVACLNCGYNLRGIDPAGACPECGLPIATALRQDRLADAPPPWLGRIGRGAHLLVVGVILSLPLPGLGPLIAAVGFWLISTRQPNRTEPRHDRLVRIFARGTLVPGALGWFTATSAMVGIMLNYHTMVVFDWRAYDSLLIGFAALLGIGVAATAQYLRTLAERTDDHALVTRCKRVFWAWIVGGLVVISTGGAVDLFNYVGRSQRSYYLGFAVLALTIMMLLALWLWFETLRLALHFRRAIRR